MNRAWMLVFGFAIACGGNEFSNEAAPVMGIEASVMDPSADADPPAETGTYVYQDAGMAQGEAEASIQVHHEVDAAEPMEAAVNETGSDAEMVTETSVSPMEAGIGEDAQLPQEAGMVADTGTPSNECVPVSVSPFTLYGGVNEATPTTSASCTPGTPSESGIQVKYGLGLDDNANGCQSCGVFTSTAVNGTISEGSCETLDMGQDLNLGEVTIQYIALQQACSNTSSCTQWTGADASNCGSSLTGVGNGFGDMYYGTSLATLQEAVGCNEQEFTVGPNNFATVKTIQCNTSTSVRYLVVCRGFDEQAPDVGIVSISSSGCQ